MRKNTVVNHENENLMDTILREMSATFSHDYDPFNIAHFVGVLLVLKKHGVLKVNSNIPNLSLLIKEDAFMSHDMTTFAQRVVKDLTTPSVKKIVLLIAVSEFSEGEYLRWYDYFLDGLLTHIKTLSFYYVPPTFATLVDALLPANTKKVFNPFGGLMRFATDMERYQALEACEIDPDIWGVGLLRLELSDNAGKALFYKRNVNCWTSDKYDAIVTIPPFNVKIQMEKSFSNSNGPEESEGIAISRLEESTTSEGCCITFVSRSFLWSSGDKARIREWATNNRYIDTIILLPKNLLETTSIPVVCLVLRKKSYHKDGVRMIDASNYFTHFRYKNNLNIDEIMDAYHQDIEKISATISFEEIEANDFSWNVEDYLHQEVIDCPDGYSLVRVEDIVHFPQITKSTENHSGIVVKISNLSEDWTHPYVDVDSIDKLNPVNGCVKITQEAILLSTIRSLKPSIVKASADRPIYVNQDILVAIPNEGVDAEYLCMILAKSNIPTIGLGVPLISKSRILRLQIALPELIVQKNLYREASREKALSTIKELGLQELIEQMRADYINVVRTRKHDMMPYVRELGSFERTIRHYVSKRDDMSDFSEKMNSLLDRYKENLAKLSELINIFSEEEQFGEPEQFNLNKYLIELETSHDESKGYWIEYDRDDNALAEYGIPVSLGVYTDTFEPVDPDSKLGKELIEEENEFPVIVEINHLDFERLVRNIIENAITHGFTDSNRKDYGIGIDLTVDMERGMFQIDFSNNGTPLPTGMDKQRYGLLGEKAGLTGRTGRGGYIIKSIVEHYHGDYDVFMNGSNTVVRILLPIAHYDYDI